MRESVFGDAAVMSFISPNPSIRPTSMQAQLCDEEYAVSHSMPYVFSNLWSRMCCCYLLRKRILQSKGSRVWRPDH